MKKLLFFGIAAFTAAAISGCQKEESLSKSAGANPNQNIAPVREYRLDNNVVSENDINKQDLTLQVVITIEEKLLTYNYFTCKKNCNDWLSSKPGGEEILRKQQQGEHLRAYAEKIGAIQHFENTGLLMAEYRQYEREYLGDRPTGGGGRALGSWYTEPTGAGPSFPTVHWPAFGGVWNNNISSVMAIGGPTIYYDRTFYRDHIGTIWHLAPANYFVTFQGTTLDNRTSSALSF